MEFIYDFLRVVLIMLAVCAVIALLFTAHERTKRAAAKAEIERAATASGLTFEQIQHGNNNTAIAVDLTARQVCLVSRKHEQFTARVLPLASVLSSQIQTQSVVLMAAERKSGLGRAVAGGLLFGGAGAVVGAVTGSKQRDAIETNVYELHLTINDIKDPYFMIIFSKFEDARRWQALFEVAFTEAQQPAHDL